MPEYSYIQSQSELDRAIQTLLGAKRVGLDTESSGYYTYEPEICLIQASAGDRHFIIDPLAKLDLGGLGPLFEKNSIQKIFHSAFSDVQELRRIVDWSFHNVFDTFIACRMLGFGSCSLASLVEAYCGITLQKGEQKSNWKRRPLSRSQLDYASLDTVYLEKIASSLEKALADGGLLEEFYDEVEWSLKGPPPTEKVFDPDGWMSIQGSQDLNPRQRGYLASLFALRDRRSREQNVTPFRYLGNREMVELARRMPETRSDLDKSGVVGNRFLKDEGDLVIEARKGIRPVPDSAFPAYERPDPAIENRFRQLKKWRSWVSENRNMDPSVILNNRVLYAIATSRPTSLEELSRQELMSEFKFNKYGKDLVQTVQNGFHQDP